MATPVRLVLHRSPSNSATPLSPVAVNVTAAGGKSPFDQDETCSVPGTAASDTSTSTASRHRASVDGARDATRLFRAVLEQKPVGLPSDPPRMSAEPTAETFDDVARGVRAEMADLRAAMASFPRVPAAHPPVPLVAAAGVFDSIPNTPRTASTASAEGSPEPARVPVSSAAAVGRVDAAVQAEPRTGQAALPPTQSMRRLATKLSSLRNAQRSASQAATRQALLLDAAAAELDTLIRREPRAAAATGPRPLRGCPPPPVAAHLRPKATEPASRRPVSARPLRPTVAQRAPAEAAGVYRRTVAQSCRPTARPAPVMDKPRLGGPRPARVVLPVPPRTTFRPLH